MVYKITKVNLMTVPILTIPDKEQSVEYFRKIAGSAHTEFTSRFNSRTNCGSLNMPNYDVRQNVIIDPKLADAILFFPPVTLMEQICKIKFGKPLFITGGISQLMMWNGLPITITNNKDKEVFQFDDRCSRDVDMKTVLTLAEFGELAEIVLEIYKDNAIDG
ncbi:MAG TPA: hypothetical protein PK957_04030 [Candidatus Dojkabacteria bacterium]|nr:hypothetical protein [Candidatus Dojkabacteria bacterium]HQF36234.1 hypothetical protein [Candidatus Dojkabacteria bacterium]